MSESIKQTLLDDEIDDQLFFMEEDEVEERNSSLQPWKVMIVDDEAEVHSVTKMVLDGFVFDGRPLEFISAYSGKEACEQIRKHPDTALILLDVVMEEDNSGLQVVEFIRKKIQNSFVRIILRTGQPGQAPEEKVILEYDINDYKAKTELTTQKLITTFISALRNFRDIMTIEANKIGLEKIITASAKIFQANSIEDFAVETLLHVNSIVDTSFEKGNKSGFAAEYQNGNIIGIRGIGKYKLLTRTPIETLVDPTIVDSFQQVLDKKQNLYFEDYYIYYICGKSGAETFIYFEDKKDLQGWQKNLIEIFCVNVSIAFDNLLLHEEIENTQRDLLFAMGEIAEARSKETGKHVERVSEYCRVLGLLLGMSNTEANLLKLASTMHDVGKLGIPDSILNKPDKLTKEEFEIMKTHTSLGYDMLKKSDRKIIKAAALIAHQHQEKWNGSGYPQGLKEENIHLYARIVAVADVFDALACKRVYKEAWSFDDVRTFLIEQRGKHFDPKIVDLFVANINEFVLIKNALVDE
ncbi:MAG: response regulator RpfG family c-di-GMP phosphodiesterase [bacterium]|jgi:response regulator RpfG family c-di-GMP phosphodiesterase